MTRINKQHLIIAAYAFNDAARKAASCNSLYMGSMATAELMSRLGGRYGHDSLAELVNRATDDQLDAGLEVCQNIIQYGKISCGD